MSSLLNWFKLVYGSFGQSILCKVHLIYTQTSQERIKCTRAIDWLRAYCPLSYIYTLPRGEFRWRTGKTWLEYSSSKDLRMMIWAIRRDVAQWGWILFWSWISIQTSILWWKILEAFNLSWNEKFRHFLWNCSCKICNWNATS